MNELSTLPLSVRQQMERSQQLATRSQPEGAKTALQTILGELASREPQLCALLVAAQMGYRQITVTETEWNSTTVRTERRALGFEYGVEETTRGNQRTHRKSWSL